MNEIRSWMIMAWAKQPVRRAEPGAMPRLTHVSTTVHEHTLDEALRCGETCWVANMGGQQALGLAWEWVEVMPGVVAIRDPNTIVSNALWQDVDGDAQDELSAIVTANLLVHSAPWQQRVAALLQRAGTVVPQHAAAASARRAGPRHRGQRPLRLAA